MEEKETIENELEISDLKPDFNSEDAYKFKSNIKRLSEESVYVFSFPLNQMVYADGWFDMVGYPDEEISLLKLVEITENSFRPFIDEINRVAFQYFTNEQHLEGSGLCMYLKMVHVSGESIPVAVTFHLIESDENGIATKVLGRVRKDSSLLFGDIMKFAVFGPQMDQFKNMLSMEIFHPFQLTDKEKEVIDLLSIGLTYKEIADNLFITQSAVEKRIRPLFNRFHVKNNAHLVAFALRNGLLK